MINNKLLCRIIIAVLLATLIPTVAFADGGDGSGDGDGKGLGENKDIVLTLENSSVSDNASNVAINETIQLDFNKNICNITVLANNKMCFHLTDGNGDAVPIKLIFPDDQVQQDYKRQVFIIPQQDLESNSRYRIAVDNTLTAKNGTLIDNAHTITFTTGSNRTNAENKALKKLGENIVTYETAYSETGDSVPVNKNGLDENSGKSEHNTAFIAKAATIAIILIIVIFTSILIFFRRKK